MTIKEIQMDIAASCWLKPQTEEELRTIDALRNMAQYGADKMIGFAKDRGYIYQKGDKYYCYKKTVEEVLNPNGYELEIPSDDRTDFEKAFEKFNSQFS